MGPDGYPLRSEAPGLAACAWCTRTAIRPEAGEVSVVTYNVNFYTQAKLQSFTASTATAQRRPTNLTFVSSAH